MVLIAEMLSNMYSSETDQVSKLTEKQGIVTVLGSDMETMGAAVSVSVSLRRTLSADMSCSKWLAQNGVPPLKRTPSSKELYLPETVTPDSSSRGEEGAQRGRDEIWTSIQQDKMNERNKMLQVTAQQDRSDIWSSIISQKDCELIVSKSVPPPYVHPLVKLTQSSLSKKSLEICTESLGSETGSDGISSHPPSETEDTEDHDKVEEQDQQQSYDAAEEDCRVDRYNYPAAAETVTTRSFPPPLPSLSHCAGASLRMRSTVRDNGRLVVEAVPVPSQKNFHAERQHGRLLLTFDDKDEQVLGNHDVKEQKMDDMEESSFAVSEYDQGEKEHVEYEDEGAERELELEGEEVDAKGIEIIIEDGIRNVSSVSIANVHRLVLKPCVLNRNLSLSQTFNEVVKFKETEEAEEKVGVMKATPVVANSLPPCPRTTRLIPSSTPVGSATSGAPGSLNAYEYYWKPRTTSKAETQIFNQFINHHDQSSQSQYNCDKKLVVAKDVPMQNDRQQVIVLRGKNGEYLVPMSKSCKESRTPVLYWQPYCIASS